MADNACRLIKLNNGDNIIAKIKKISNSIIILENPFLYKTMSMFTPNGTKNIILLKKWFEMSSDELQELSINSIISMTIPNEKIMILYEKEKRKKQLPYISNDELYKNPKLLNMMEDNVDSENIKNVKSPENSASDVYGVVNISLKITPEMLEENEGLENLLRAMGVPIDQLYEAMEQKENNEEESVDSDQTSPEFGNNLDDWSPDPNDYLK